MTLDALLKSCLDSRMVDSEAVAAFLQQRLAQLGVDDVPAVEAARWLDHAGLLTDSIDRPGLPLRKMLRAGVIPHAQQRPASPNGKWFIVRAIMSPGSTARSGGSFDDRHVSAAPTLSSIRADTRNRAVDSRCDGNRSATPTEVFKRVGLETQGFIGFALFKGIALDRLPTQQGVYVVLRESDSRPVFLARSEAGRFKGQDPTVSTKELERSWPAGAHCVYIGKAGARGGRGLQQRIKEFRQFGDGRAVGHQGGRRIWQISDADDFVLASKPTPHEDPEAVESALLRAFVAEYGMLPIGNRTIGRSTA